MGKSYVLKRIAEVQVFERSCWSAKMTAQAENRDRIDRK